MHLPLVHVVCLLASGRGPGPPQNTFKTRCELEYARVFIKKQTHKIHIEGGQGFVSFQCATAEKKGTIVIMSKNMLPTRVAWHAKKYGK